MKDDFQIREDKGRAKFERMYGRYPHEFTKGKYDSYDVSMTAGTVSYNVEIKDKNEPIEKWEKDGFILEVDKYLNLMREYWKTGSLPIYLNFFNNGDGFSCNLTEINPVWEWKPCTKTTAAGTYGEEKIMKYVYMIPADNVKKFKYE